MNTLGTYGLRPVASCGEIYLACMFAGSQPKGMFAIMLTCSGWVGFMAPESTGDFTLNSLAQAFVRKVVEHLVAEFRPVKLQETIKDHALYVSVGPGTK